MRDFCFFDPKETIKTDFNGYPCLREMIRLIQVLMDKSNSEQCTLSCGHKEANISNDCWNCMYVELKLYQEKTEDYMKQCGELN